MSEERLFPKTVDEVILEKVRFFFLPDRTAAFVKNLVEGKVSERSLICCNSGCDVCNETIYNCYMAVKKELENT
ncbi:MULTISPECIES: hypothetical protein [Leptospira]|uniref:Uncharacterized protein n=2 Tax=Leptospira TaxID=171 RepID=A0A6H3NSH1_9LEPT|nr:MULTISPECIES: hypothetical protein [Leptospira]MCG6152193.1 hypothetical protein [Leptospira bandrabouensis]MCT8332952.1 hypothetical protein [Leptospira sp. 85282-16]MCW7457819.1 hypothetical protein [Leptospira bandrabouensis]MCW7477441.1 hypothetical protein [Leptospira bandrabouensis]MCW7485123.1 hypothetical protein [Leptospira bandrabouensis]